MEINFNKHILDLDGKEINDENKNPVKSGQLVISALLASYKDHEPSCSGEDKLRRFSLSQKISLTLNSDNIDEVELATGDCVFIKGYLGRYGYGPLVYSRLESILEGK